MLIGASFSTILLDHQSLFMFKSTKTRADVLICGNRGHVNPFINHQELAWDQGDDSKGWSKCFVSQDLESDLQHCMAP